MTLTDIAIQNLRRRKGKTAFLLLTFMLVIGITVTLNTLAKSMQYDLQKSLTQYDANVVITPKSEHFTLSYGGLSVPGVDYEIKHLNYDVLTKIKTSQDLTISGIAPKIIGSVVGINDRIAEIGVFRAIGFRRRHILSILIREIVLVSFVGGVLGYLLGDIVPTLLGPIAFQKTVLFQFHPLMALVALSASVLVGSISIVLPARRAVQLDPLAALSYI